MLTGCSKLNSWRVSLYSWLTSGSYGLLPSPHRSTHASDFYRHENVKRTKLEPRCSSPMWWVIRESSRLWFLPVSKSENDRVCAVCNVFLNLFSVEREILLDTHSRAWPGGQAATKKLQQGSDFLLAFFLDFLFPTKLVNRNLFPCISWRVVFVLSGLILPTLPNAVANKAAAFFKISKLEF